MSDEAESERELFLSEIEFEQRKDDVLFAFTDQGFVRISEQDAQRLKKWLEKWYPAP